MLLSKSCRASAVRARARGPGVSWRGGQGLGGKTRRDGDGDAAAWLAAHPAAAYGALALPHSTVKNTLHGHGAEVLLGARLAAAAAAGDATRRGAGPQGTRGPGRSGLPSPGPRSSRTCSAQSTLCAMSKYGNILSLVTWLARSRNASGSMAADVVLSAWSRRGAGGGTGP